MRETIKTAKIGMVSERFNFVPRLLNLYRGSLKPTPLSAKSVRHPLRVEEIKYWRKKNIKTVNINITTAPLMKITKTLVIIPPLTKHSVIMLKIITKLLLLRPILAPSIGRVERW